MLVRPGDDDQSPERQERPAGRKLAQRVHRDNADSTQEFQVNGVNELARPRVERASERDASTTRRSLSRPLDDDACCVPVAQIHVGREAHAR